VTERGSRGLTPPLKWAGGKRWLSQRHSGLLPDFTGTYYEPFFGGGAVFFHLRPKKAVLSDLNADLITTYRALSTDWQAVKEGLAAHAQLHSSEYYYQTRAEKPDEEAALAAWFLYMNRACYNGLYRVNKQGTFNVPKGTKDKIVFEYDAFEKISLALSVAEIEISDFEHLIDRSNSGDFVYIDPPYTVRHNNNGFLKYNEQIFSWDDQKRLARAVRRAAAREVKLLVSNANHESVRRLYRAHGTVVKLDRYSVIGGGEDYRARTSEIAVRINY
jgi:DNA adenine methylase